VGLATGVGAAVSYPRVMRFSSIVLVFFGTATITSGCAEETRPPSPPARDASISDTSPIVTPPRRDSGAMDASADSSADGAMDGATDATVDAALPLGCFVAGEGTGTTADIAIGGEAFPFAITRSFATWDPARCLTSPTVIVGLTEGSCTPSIGDQLIFSLRESAILNTIQLGTNTLFVEPDDVGLTVRFRSTGAGGGADEWGTCAGASGTVDFTDLGSVVGSRLTATYDMILTDCRPPFDSAPIAVSGAFDLTLDVSLETICL